MISRNALNISLAAGMMLLPSLAGAWTAWNRHEVYQVSKGVFEVLNEVGSGATDYWCGIGDYAIAQLRTKATQRIYISKAIGPSTVRQGRKGVQFTLTPPPDVDTNPGYSVTVKRVGDNMNAATARNYCYDRIEDRFWFP